MKNPVNEQLIDYPHLEEMLTEYFPEEAWQDWFASLPAVVNETCNPKRHGDLQGWLETLGSLPSAKVEDFDLSAARMRIGSGQGISEDSQQALKEKLLALKPWRKGPFEVQGIHIDTEWRSDWKWARVAPHINLVGRRVLDIGCGNGYYALRMLGAGASCVVGVDPSPRFIVQYNAIKHFLPQHPNFHLLPIGIEHLEEKMPWFDTVFSMGVFYHRRSPIDHLLELRHKLRSGGELVLETLVIEGGVNDVLVPDDRYAMMRNVWFLPSCAALELWAKRAGFKHIRIVDVSDTSLDEQRATEWMSFHSLEDFLDPKDHSKTIEGHPAPKRAVLVAEAP